jgi:hypothetical protein
MNIINVGVGFMLLIAGRPAYFVFTGVVALLMGSFLASRFDLAPTTWNTIYVPAIFGVIGIALAFAFKRWSAYAAGFLAGGYLVYNLPQVFDVPQPAWATPVTFAIAGLISVILLLVAFDAFLVFLSAVTGVTLILRGISFGRIEPVIMFVILLVFSAICQYLIFEYGHPSPD